MKHLTCRDIHEALDILRRREFEMLDMQRRHEVLDMQAASV